MPLTPKQQRFVEEYLVDLNATQAAIRAGYAKANADVTGPRMLRNVGVAAAVEVGRAKLADASAVTADMVRREIALIALADPRSVMTWGPRGVTLIDSAKLTRDQAALVAEVAQTKDGIRLKTHSKLDALGKLIALMGIEAPTKSEIAVMVEDVTPLDRARAIAFALAKAGRAAAEPGKD